MILTGGTDPGPIARLADRAARSLEAYQSGRLPEPILLVAPGDTGAPESLAEAREGTAFLVRTSGSTTGSFARCWIARVRGSTSVVPAKRSLAILPPTA